MTKYDHIVSVAAEAAQAHAGDLARAGIVANLRLYYKFEALRLQSTAVNHDLEAEGWKATDRFLPCSSSYPAYWQWIKRNSGDLPIYAAPSRSRTDTYTGPFPRKRHSHRCSGCGDRNAVACYKSQCSRPQSVQSCHHCRPLNGYNHGS